MNRVLVTGADGFVGRAVVCRLAADGCAVLAGGRTRPGVAAGVTGVALGDLADGTDRSALLSGVDVVVHCAARAHVLREGVDNPLTVFRAVNRDATVALARDAAQAGVRRFVFLSSIGVNGGETHGRPFTVDQPPSPHTPYAVAKWEAEQALAEMAERDLLEVVVIRPPLVLGPDPKGNLGALLRAIRAGVPLPLGAVTGNRRDLVSIDVLTDLIARAIDHPAAPGTPLLVCDGWPLSTRGVVQAVARHAGRPARLLPVPPALLSTVLRATGRRSLASQLFGDLEIDMGSTMARLDWRPRAQDMEAIAR